MFKVLGFKVEGFFRCLGFSRCVQELGFRVFRGSGFDVFYLPSIMQVACGLVPGEKLKVEPSMTRRASTPITR